MILMVGATGALGGQVARALLGRGHPVRVLVRPGSDYGALVEAGAQPVMGDLKDPASLARACAGVATLVTTANSSARGGADTTESVDLRGNRALIDAARTAGVGHFVFTSALGVSAASPVEFFRAKAATEAHLQASGLTYTILQPNLFMEVWLGMMVCQPLQQGAVVTLVEPGTHRHAFVSARDVAAFAVAAVTHPVARERTVVIGGPAAHSWTDVVGIAEQVIGRPIEVRFVAPGEPLPGLPEVVSQLATSFETYETVLDMTETAATFGVRLTSVEDFLRGMLRPTLPA